MHSSELKPNQYSCSNPKCLRKVIRKPSAIQPSGKVYCSSSCSAKITNTLRASRKFPRKKCMVIECTNEVEELNSLFCSRKCRYTYGYAKRGYTKAGIIKTLRDFFQQNNRIPLKREMNRYYRPARRLFGTWNNAVTAAGFEPIKTKFSKNWQAKDGHICNSLVEKILDDWFHRHNIEHEVHMRYPWGGMMTADFKVKDYWIELFGLKGQLARYDILRRKKLALIKKYQLKLIALSTKDVLNTKTLNIKLAPVC